MLSKITKLLPTAALTLFFSGCGNYLHQPLGDRNARLGESTPVTTLLSELPAPQEKVVTAVYKFRDQTGQYKPQEVGSSFSTAVTQGATNILIKALEDSGWFRVIERENVGNLLNERKIIRSSRQQYGENNGQALLPPLLFAGMIIEGGIVSYDANIVTGGAGLRYFGAGGSGQYRQDRVTVYLRAISSNTGEVLKTIYTSKTILSQAVDAGLFRFVSFRRLLEVETGFTYNEPSQMAVMEAIEKAVYSLIIEGLIDGFWEVNLVDIGKKERLIVEYQEEQERMALTDAIGRKRLDPHTGVSLSIGVTSLRYQGDYPNPDFGFGGELSLQGQISPVFGISVGGGLGRLTTNSLYSEQIYYAKANGLFRLLPFERLSPIIYGGGGVLFDQDGTPESPQRRNYGYLNGGLGFEYQLSPWLAAGLNFDINFVMNDKIDGLNMGKYNDFFYGGQLGFRILFNQRDLKP